MPILGLNTENYSGKENAISNTKKSKKALIIFTRNPELGKCKTRLAATVGDKNALDIYTFLLKHTVAITTSLPVDVYVYYSVKIRENDLWSNTIYKKMKQQGNDLGARMHHAFTQIFEMNYDQAIIIGSDMYDLSTAHINNAFTQLNSTNFVVGPAQDGGYYLLGMKKPTPKLFSNKKWGTQTVLEETLLDLKDESVALLEIKNDVDYYEDIKDHKDFQPFFPENLKTKK